MSSKKDQGEEIDSEIMEVAGLSPDQALIYICVHMAEIRRRQGKHSKEHSDGQDKIWNELKDQRIARKVIDDATAIIIDKLKQDVLTLQIEKRTNVRWIVAICSISTAASGLLAVILPWVLK